MKLLRYGPAGQEKPGLLDGNRQIRDLSEIVKDIDGAALSPVALDRLGRLDPARLAPGAGGAARGRLRRRGAKNPPDRAQLPAARGRSRDADPERADLLYE